MNKVIIMGRLCADPEFRQTNNGIPCCRFRVAINRPKTKDGDQQADFINVVCWRQKGEFVSRYFSKGSMIIVEGQLRNNDYTDNNGVKHYGIEVLADNVEFGESKQASSAAPPQNQVQGGYPAAPQGNYAPVPQQYQQQYQQTVPQGYPQQQYTPVPEQYNTNQYPR